MVEKVRLSVDRETQEILRAVTDGLESFLSEKPAWAGELQQDLLEKLASVVTARPSWTNDLQADVVTATRTGMQSVLEVLGDLKKAVAELNRKVQENRSTLEGAEVRLSLSLRRIEASLTTHQNALATTQKVLEKIEAALARHEALLVRPNRPWWKRLFGG